MIHFSLQKRLHGLSEEGFMDLDLSCDLDPGSFNALFGPSGAGKTSVLRMLAGLMAPDKGVIEINGDVWLNTTQGVDQKPQKRKVGYVFQEYALFPNMSVRKNLEYALAPGQEKSKVDELMEIIELTQLQKRKPKTLSGGQQQRVALARAVIGEPSLLLMDEPLSALDNQMRTKLQDYLLTIHEEYRMTTLWVSHDLPEIFRMSDRVILLEQGKIVREGPPEEVFMQQTSEVGTWTFTGEVLGVLEKEGYVTVSIWGELGKVELEISAEVAMDLKQRDKVRVSSKGGQQQVHKME